MSDLNRDVVDLVWGKQSTGVSASLFRRWTQGFVFSETERSALEQFEGGPCAVIAPVQAFLLKNILFNRESSNWRDVSEEEQRTALCSTLAEILESACGGRGASFCLATWARGKGSSDVTDIPDSPPEPESSRPADAHPKLCMCVGMFVSSKRTLKTVAELKESVLSLYDTWRNKFGVLLFLYSVILTKGIENIKNEIEDSTEPLIDPVYGHGSQSLINLLVTGHAVSNVWDGDRECSGMSKRALHLFCLQLGPPPFFSLSFLPLLSQVGSLLKSPKFPIWILGSETHLSVFFGKEMSLVAPESPSEQARRVFQTFDPEDNGFIPDTLLEDVMKALDLVSEPEYVNLMKSKLDPEGLGIVLLGPFLLEFFPDQDTGIPDSFPVYHYNGLKQSNHDEKVSYVEGTALVLGFEDPMVRTDDTPIKRCLQTKWPYVELLWTTERSPSLN
uniref:Ubiquitin carboxyl-terminal hydrolase MINDY n=1 Tax=Electrophorus electricus TaxID=8005 RepID=A0AAY5EWR8_ELEEL